MFLPSTWWSAEWGLSLENLCLLSVLVRIPKPRNEMGSGDEAVRIGKRRFASMNLAMRLACIVNAFVREQRREGGKER